MIPNRISLYETIVVSANEQLVSLFLDGKINFSDVTRLLKKIMKMNIFMKYKKRVPKNFNELINLSKFVRLKTNLLSVRSDQ
jgi:1-deoxy-D-xylulose-5-phosphate reductoisomerase